MTDLLASIALVTGTAFIALSALGVLRLPDPYSRLHAITKASTLGTAGVLLGSLLQFWGAGIPAIAELVAIWFVTLTNPVGGHMIGRSAYLIGIPLTDRTMIDELGCAGSRRPERHDVQ